MKSKSYFFILIVIFTNQAYADTFSCLKAINSALIASVKLGDYPSYEAAAVCANIDFTNGVLKELVTQSVEGRLYLNNIQVAKMSGKKAPELVYNSTILMQRNLLTSTLSNSTVNTEKIYQLIVFDATHQLLCYQPKGCDGLCSAAKELKDTSQDLSHCAAKYDFENDCSRKYRDVKDAQEKYEELIDDLPDFCKQ